MSPLKAIRAECLACMGGSPSLVAACPSQGTCHLWPYRLGRKPATGEHHPLAAIRAHCLTGAGSAREARACSGELLGGGRCPLHPFRFGRNPARRHGRQPATPIQKAIQSRSQQAFSPQEEAIAPGGEA